MAAAAPMEYGALLRLAAPCARLIALEACSGDGARGGRRGGARATAAETHQERLLRQVLVPGSGGAATAPAHELLLRRILLRGGALTSRGGEAAAAAGGHMRHVRQLLLGAAGPSRGGEATTATDHLRRLLSLGGRAGEARTDQLEEREVRLLVGLGHGGALAGRGGGATAINHHQGQHLRQILLLDGALQPWPLHLRSSDHTWGDEKLHIGLVSPPPPCAGLSTADAIAAMLIPGVLTTRQAVAKETDFQLRAIGFRPCPRSRLFLLFIAFGYVSQSSSELIAFIKKSAKFLIKAEDFAVDRLAHTWCLFSEVEFVACLEEMLRVAALVC